MALETCRKQLLAVVLAFGSANLVFAQAKGEIRGRLVGDDGNPVIGAHVYLKALHG